MSEASQILEGSVGTVSPGEGPGKDAVAPAVSKDDNVSAKLEFLIKREQSAFQKERLAKQKEQEVLLKFKELEEREAKVKAFESAKGKNSKEALELLGLDYNQLTQSLLKDGEIPPEVEIGKLRDELGRFKQEREQDKEAQAVEAKRQSELQEQKAITDFKSEINTYLKDNNSRYELIAFENAESLVFDVIDEHYTRTIDPETGVGKVMSMSEASDKVEEHLEKKYNESRKLNKVKALWESLPKTIQSQVLKQEARPASPPKTLTNQLSATASVPRRSPVTDEERVQKAMAWLSTQKRA